MDTNKVLLVGLPSSGKTTFLAVVWYLVDGNHNTALTIDRLHGDREYLNTIRDKWLSCDPLDRTRPINEPLLTMRLINIQTQTSVELTIPELSGETFLEQWTKRTLTEEYQGKISGSSGALLFIHPNQVVEPTRIDQAVQLFNEISDVYGDNYESVEFVEWNAKNSPTQVELVELLQFAEGYEDVKFPFKIAVIVSAWDQIAHLNQSPEMWLKERLPLLYQYLYSNSHIFPHRVYGVSAQGGDYSSDEEKLIAFSDPCERIIFVGPSVSGYDLTMILAWLIEDGK